MGILMGGKHWTPEEDILLTRIYFDGKKDEILKGLNNKTWKSIEHHASKLKLHRKYMRDEKHRKWTKQSALAYLKRLEKKYGYVNSTILEWANTSLHVIMKSHKDWNIKQLVNWDARKHIKNRGKKAEIRAETHILPHLGFTNLYRSHNRYGVFDIVGIDPLQQPAVIEVTTIPPSTNHIRKKRDMIIICKILNIKLYVLHTHPIDIEKYKLKEVEKDEEIEWKREGKYRGSGWK